MAKQRNYNGIHMENSIRITSEAPTGNSILVMLGQWLVILAGISSLVFGVVSGLELVPDYRFLIWGIVITTAIHVLIHEIKIASIYTAAVYLILVLYAFYRFFPMIENGFYCLENAILKKAAPYYGFKEVHFLVEGDPKFAITALLLALIQIAAFVTAKEVYRHYMRSIYVLFAVLCYGLLLGVGQTPNAFWLLVTICVIIAMRSMDSVPNAVKREIPDKGITGIQGSKRLKIRIKTAYISGLILILLVLLSRLCISELSYEALDLTTKKLDFQNSIKDFSAVDVAREIKEYWQDISPFKSENNISGGLDSGKLVHQGEISFTNDSALLVTMDEDTSFLYLKGFAGTDYTSDAWEDLSGSDLKEFEQIQQKYDVDSYLPETLLYEYIYEYRLFNGDTDTVGIQDRLLTADLTPGVVTVDYVNANKKFMYAPYLTVYSREDELYLVGDQYLKPKEKNAAYEFSSVYQPANYFTDLNQLLAGIYDAAELKDFTFQNQQYADYERSYREFVHDVYTRLPKTGLDRLKGVQLCVSGNGIEGEIQAIQEVLRYLQENTSYSLSPGIPDSDTDYAEYFLFDAHRGYCSHYATAATLLLRNYGVPARYVEGYVVPQEEIIAGAQSGTSMVNVTDMNAHAWVEVYFDGVGWVPIEVTNGYSEEGPVQIIPEIEQAAGTQAPTPTVTQSPTVTPQVTPTPTLAPGITPEHQTTPQAAQDDSLAEESKQSEEETNNTVWKVLRVVTTVLAAAVLILTAFYIRYLLFKKHYDRGLQSKNQSRRVLVYYRKIERILSNAHITKCESMSYEEFASQAQRQLTVLPKGFDTMVKLALKARFGKEKLMAQEVRQIKEYYNEFRTRYVMEQKLIVRIYLKYWKVI